MKLLKKSIALLLFGGIIVTANLLTPVNVYANSENIGGQFYYGSVTVYNTWRTKIPYRRISMDGHMSGAWCVTERCQPFKQDPSDFWAIGLRRTNGRQYSRLEFHTVKGKGDFPNTYSLHAELFALSAKGGPTSIGSGMWAYFWAILYY